MKYMFSRTLSRDELLSSLEKCASFLEDSCLPKGEFKEAKRTVYDFIAKLQDVEGKLRRRNVAICRQ